MKENFSLRLVKTYNGENLVEYEKINNVIVKTDLIPSDSGESPDTIREYISFHKVKSLI